MVADHLYGWWLSGIAQRPTLSAAGLEFLIYSNELVVAKNAQLLLDTNYYIDNGLIQVKDDGPYVSRHNPLVSIETCSGEAFAMFQFNETKLEYNKENVMLSDMTISENTLAEFENSTVILTTYENDLFTVTKTLQVQQGTRIAELAYKIEAKNLQTNDFNVKFSLATGTNHNLTIDDPSKAKQIETYNSHHKVAGQVIFSELNPQIVVDPNATNCAKIIYTSQINSMNIRMSMAVFDTENLTYPEEILDIYKQIAENPTKNISSDDELNIWNYQKMIEDFDVSYVVCRDNEVYLKFAKDPNFQFLFNCGRVAIFQVIK